VPQQQGHRERALPEYRDRALPDYRDHELPDYRDRALRDRALPELPEQNRL
jgi:hypothetical protein